MPDGDERFEERIRRLASKMAYPPTPPVERWVSDELAGKQPWRFQQRPLAWTVAALLLLFFVTLAFIPGARATVTETIRVGAVRIFLGPEAASGLATPRPTLEVPARGTASPTPFPRPDFAGETTLAAVEERLQEPVLLPSYPPTLGEPDRVFFQETPAAALILLWLEDQGEVKLALFRLAPSTVYGKLQPQLVQRTIVNGEPALWTTGPYLVEVEGEGLRERRLIEGHVLIWSGENFTYRLETDAPLSEAVRIAESLE